MKTENKLLFIQVGYLIVGLGTAWGIYLIEGKIKAIADLGNWKLGGAAAVSIIVYLVLVKKGPFNTMLKKYKAECKEELLPVHADVILSPDNQEDYAGLFLGFSNCDFKAYNPPFMIEERGNRIRNKALDVHLERYKLNVASRYLFYEGNSYERARNFFEELKKKALQIGISLEGKIESRYLSMEVIPAYTFFTGYRRKVPRCILYPSATRGEGLPEAVITLDGDDKLLDILANYFDRHWVEASNSEDCKYWVS